MRRLALPAACAASGVFATYFASITLQEKGKRNSTPAEFPMATKDVTTYERLSLNDVYARYKIKTLDRKKSKENVLGEGSYAHVIGCTEVRTGKNVALKVVKKAFTKAPDFEREVSALTAARIHPNVVQLLDVIDVPDADSWLLVTELLEGGELFDRILEKGAFSERATAQLVRKVASSLSCLHRLGWAHNDVKPENLVYCSKHPDSEIKLVDFGMARRHPDSVEKDTKPITRDLGTTAYWPPEVLNSKTRFKCDPRPIDGWTLGVLTYILLFGCHPFDRTGDASEDVMASRIALGTGEGSYIDYDFLESDLAISENARDFLKRLLEEDPVKRMTVDEVLEHPFIQDAMTSDEEKDDRATPSTRAARLQGERDAQAALAAILKLASDRSASRDALQPLGRSSAYVSGGKEPHAFEDLPEPLRTKLETRYLRTYDDVIYNVGDSTDGLYVLVKGRANIEYPSENGKFVVVQTLYPGDLFGETALLEGRGTRNARLRAVDGPLEAYFFARDDVVAVLSGSSELKERLDDLNARRYRIRAANALVKCLEAEPSLGKTVYVEKGECVFRKGEVSDQIYLVKSGVIKSVIPGSGEEASTNKDQSETKPTKLHLALGAPTTSQQPTLVIGEWGPGDVFGISALYGSSRFASALAQTPAEVIAVKREDLEHVLEHEPMLRENLAQQFRTFKERSSSIARKYTRRRSELSTKEPSGEPKVVSIKKQTVPDKLPSKAQSQDDIITLKQGDILFRSGDSSSTGVFFVVEGEVHLKDDSGQTVYVNGKNMTFGTESFVKRAPRKFTAVAAKDTKLMRALVRRSDEEEEDGN